MRDRTPHTPTRHALVHRHARQQQHRRSERGGRLDSQSVRTRSVVDPHERTVVTAQQQRSDERRGEPHRLADRLDDGVARRRVLHDRRADRAPTGARVAAQVGLTATNAADKLHVPC